MAEQVGWAFAVSAGRRRDYTVIAAPDFMVDAGAHGALADVAAPTPAEQPPRVTTMQAAGQRWNLAYRTKVVDADDLTRGTETGASEPDTGRLLDEHGRPLRLIYGFVCSQDIASVDASDLERAHRSVRAALTALLGEEEGFRSRRTAAFPLRSGLRPPPGEPASAVTIQMPATGSRHRHAHRAEGPGPVRARYGAKQLVRRPLVPAVAAAALLLGGGTALAGRYLPTDGGGVQPLAPQTSSNSAAELPVYVQEPRETPRYAHGAACCRIAQK
jgi:hypothetical protein